ncbi:glycoside hydrolase family 66 protein [Salinibacterium sp. TMP30]|uniref:glycoside hydrolase family 66 protein n=1 Tax=Salinibacterium sp. TMP30 TaxID=3138237 RepID=UPI0031390A7A
MIELLPTKSTFTPGELVEIEIRGDAPRGKMSVWYLGDSVLELDYDGSATIALPGLGIGSYGIELSDGTSTVRTAVQVAEQSAARLRYGFVVDYSPNRDLTGVSDTVRRLHLTGVQFYDWAYRHAELMGGGENYTDALAQPISLATVRELVQVVQQAGAKALGYAAVYAVGPDEWPAWQHQALLNGAQAPYGLGDFLFLVDPAAPDWLEHFVGDLTAAVDSVGFDGFHLDQYGYPKMARRPDGDIVDVAQSFTTMIDTVRSGLPEATLVFNNVNDFPTWSTGSSPQDAVYIEVWSPQETLGSLASVVTRARTVAGSKPIVIAAYQHVYDSAPTAESDRATALTMAALYSHGATHLLAGEADRILVDPYYVRNHPVEPSTAELLKRWYDFLVEHDELLLDTSIVDVTGATVGAYNDDTDVTFESAIVGETGLPGEIWRRVTESNGRRIIHLINLVGQVDSLWDAPRNPTADVGAGRVKIRRIPGCVPRVQVADPDGLGRLIDVEVTVDGEFAFAVLPPLAVWQLVLIDPTSRQGEDNDNR